MLHKALARCGAPWRCIPTIRPAQVASSGTRIDTGTPSVLFALPRGPHRDTNIAWYAASRDGQRFLVNTVVEDASPITVLLNWKPKG